LTVTLCSTIPNEGEWGCIWRHFSQLLLAHVFRVLCLVMGGDRGSREKHVQVLGAAKWAWLQADWVKVNWVFYQLGLNYFIRYTAPQTQGSEEA
jgi:hypothetical protein